MGTNISEVLSTHQHIETMFASNKVRELQVVIKFGVTQLAVVPRALSYNLDFCNILQAYSNRTSGITLQIMKRWKCTTKSEHLHLNDCKTSCHALSHQLHVSTYFSQVLYLPVYNVFFPLNLDPNFNCHVLHHYTQLNTVITIIKHSGVYLSFTG